MLDPSAASKGLLTGGGAGDGDLLQLFLLEQRGSQPGEDRASPLRVPGLLGIHPVALCRQQSGEAGRTIPQGCSPGAPSARAALIGPSAVPAGTMLSQTSFCHTPGHKTHSLASNLENNTLRGMAFCWSENFSGPRPRGQPKYRS